MSDQGWKQFERRIARDHGVERRPNTGERDGSDAMPHGRCGVYAIVNTESGVAYIGCSANLSRRRATHWRDLEAGRHHNAYLQRAWTKHGRDVFEWFVLERCERDNLSSTERFWTAAHWRNYNIAPPGGLPPANRGRTMSPEARRKISERRRGISGTGLKLNPGLAKEIRNLKPADWPQAYRRSGRWVRTPANAVAQQYGVHKVTINAIWSGAIWVNA